MPITQQFVLAGNSTFTIEIPASAGQSVPHYTFKVEKVEKSDRWPEAYFAKLLTGSDNENDYTYIGKLDPITGEVKTTQKSQEYADSYALRLLNRTLARVWVDDHAAYQQHGYETHHEGRCGRCGRKLTTPASVESGIGPECSRRLQLV